MLNGFKNFVQASLIFFFVLCLSAGSAAGQSDDNISKFKNILQRMNPSRRESVIIAEKEFHKLFQKDDKNAEPGFRLFSKFYYTVIEKNSEPFFRNEDLSGMLSEFPDLADGTDENPFSGFEKLETKKKNEIRNRYAKILKEFAEYRKCGMKISPNGEGGWYLNEDFDFLSDMMDDYPLEIKDYLLFMKKAAKQVVAMDGGLVIPCDDLRKRIIRFEEFARNHPKLQETEIRISPELKNLVSIYLSGLDNTPAFDWESGTLNKEFKESYELFLKENKTSSYHRLIQQVYDIHKKHNFRKNAEAEKFIDRLKL